MTEHKVDDLTWEERQQLAVARGLSWLAAHWRELGGAYRLTVHSLTPGVEVVAQGRDSDVAETITFWDLPFTRRVGALVFHSREVADGVVLTVVAVTR